MSGSRAPPSITGPPPLVDPAEAAAVVAGLMTWPEAADPMPPWLFPEHAASFGRGLAAVRSYGGALLADPVGTGKTYVALAIAARLDSVEPIQVVAPAVLEHQWRRVSARTGLAIEVTSHERISRGESIGPRGAVIVDESHRFRNPDTKRYRALAPALIGRRTILVSATPVVNRLADLVHQLLLAVRDDVLRFHGLPSLRLLGDQRDPPLPIARLVIRDRQAPAEVPSRADQRLGWHGPDDPFFLPTLQAVDRLRLSSDAGIASLIRSGLYRALGSSPAALLASVRRYRLLVEHAALARRAGKRIDRREIWRAAGVLPEQLVMWELLDGAGQDPGDLSTADRSRLAGLESLLRRWLERGDRKTEILKALLHDRAPTLVFAGSVETVAHLRRGLALAGTAWITGLQAGFGSVRATRKMVLDAFAPGGEAVSRADRPWLLLATDVAAEGLDLQRVGRIVHFDLPWTSVRLEQRDGRALRRGSSHRSVEVIQLDPPVELESRLRLLERLEHKRRLPAAVGLADQVEQAWRVTDRLRATFTARDGPDGSAVVASPERFSIAAAELDLGTERVGLILTDPGTGQWTADPVLAEAILRSVSRAAPLPADRERLDDVIRAVRPVFNQRLADMHTADLLGMDDTSRAAIRRIRELAVEAARERRLEQVAECDRALRFLHRGRSAGEETIVAAIARGHPEAIRRAAELATLVLPPIEFRIRALITSIPSAR